jgi:hypothetical protein
MYRTEGRQNKQSFDDDDDDYDDYDDDEEEEEVEVTKEDCILSWSLVAVACFCRRTLFATKALQNQPRTKNVDPTEARRRVKALCQCQKVPLRKQRWWEPEKYRCSMMISTRRRSSRTTLDENATTIVQRETKQERHYYVAALETAFKRACSLRELHGQWTHPRTGVISLYCHVMEIKEDLDFAMYACNSDQVYADFVEESRRFPVVTIALMMVLVVVFLYEIHFNERFPDNPFLDRQQKRW